MKSLMDHYIDGRWTPPVEPHPVDVINPATEEPFATISLGTQADVNAAVAAAKTAFESWGRTRPAERIELLGRIADIY